MVGVGRRRRRAVQTKGAASSPNGETAMASEGTGEGRESVFSAGNEIEVQHGQTSMVLMHSGRILAWRTSDFAGRPTVRLALTAGPGARICLPCPRLRSRQSDTGSWRADPGVQVVRVRWRCLSRARHGRLHQLRKPGESPGRTTSGGRGSALLTSPATSLSPGRPAGSGLERLPRSAVAIAFGRDGRSRFGRGSAVPWPPEDLRR
jgi:hypothetical protein